MLIDATHPEETRVVVANGNSLEEFDFEAANRKQLKGNIYLAKVTRVEPSLQAAFVEYGGNRHGFLAFSEIHPDYYQIPVADRQALIAQQRAVADEDADFSGSEDPQEKPRRRGGRRRQAKAEAPAAEEADTEASAEAADEPTGDEVETVSGEELDEISKRPPIQQRYRIQEVIKRRQILLVQVTKEERGNKGAALTTYVSLAGRYCVLMPNTSRGGGISRKIQSGEARKRLRQVVSRLKVPDGMAVILRTAGQERLLSEIKRDFHYLVRLWDSIREKTLQATAPSLIHEEANLIKRSIRDLYRADIEEILVEGENGYRIAKDFMRNLMPSRAKLVQPYKDHTPLFHRFQIEKQLDAMHSETVQLPSGGYVVINPTEALVAIDVNSGRATRERNIEETATKTNLEAAEEISRQLRLRDLAGLIVIDFIDMEENRNVRAVEKRLKEAVRIDRARIQMGRISHFGLLELSRQRLRPSLLETSSEICTACQGTGRIRSVDSASLHVLRAIEEEGLKFRSTELDVIAPTSVALYILNQKRDALLDLENRYMFQVIMSADDSLVPPDFKLEQITARDPAETAEILAERPEEIIVDEEPKESGGRRRRRRRRRGGEPRDQVAEAAGETNTEIEAAEDTPSAGEEDGDGASKRRRRGRRGGRRRGRGRDNRNGDATALDAQQDSSDEGQDAAAIEADLAESAPDTDTEASEPIRTEPSQTSEEPDAPTATPADAESESVTAEATSTPQDATEVAAVEDEKPKPRRTRRPRRKANGADEKEPKPRTRKPRASTKKAATSEAEKSETPEQAPASAKSIPIKPDDIAPASQAATADELPKGNGGGPGTEAETAIPPSADPVADPPAEPRRGWWQKLTGL